MGSPNASAAPAHAPKSQLGKPLLSVVIVDVTVVHEALRATVQARTHGRH